MEEGSCPEAVRRAVRSGFDALARVVNDFRPELIIQFSPDHFNGFFYELMPTFCVGTAAESVGDWGTRAGPLDVPQHIAADLAKELIAREFDIATSYRMKVDHGFVQIWENLFGAATHLPIVPIFINAAAPPLPSFRRARLLGQAVGAFAVATGLRVLMVASGGLSHDPPTPLLETASPEVRERLINVQPPTPAAHAARRERVRAASELVLSGAPEILPVSEEWDRRFLEAFVADELSSYDQISTAELVKLAGRGAPEVLCWVAAQAAAKAAGPLQIDIHFYAAIQGWLAGMAIVSGRTARPADQTTGEIE